LLSGAAVADLSKLQRGIESFQRKSNTL
jgi:hypothetical protein